MNGIRPLVSVILPAYNAEANLAEAIESVLGQTYSEFELLLVDDGSSDRTPQVAMDYRDSRIRVIRNEVNLGLVGTLNKATSLAGGKYLARMDADDIAVPDRFRWQVEYLEAHPEVTVLGGGIEYIDEFGRVTGRPRRTVCDSRLIAWRLLFGNCLNHPTVMMRKESLPEASSLYSERFKHAEDYELWLRLSRSFKVENLDRCLLQYRVHSRSVSSVHNQAQVDSSVRALAEHLTLKFGVARAPRVLEAILFARQGANVPEAEVAAHFEACSPRRLAAELGASKESAGALFRFLLAKTIFFRLKRFREFSPALIRLFLASLRT